PAMLSAQFAATAPSSHVISSLSLHDALPILRVALDNKATGAHMTRTTDSSGEYSFLQIPPGQYTVTVTMTGFGQGGSAGSYIHRDRKSTRLNSSHVSSSYAGFCLTTKLSATW